MRGKKKYGITFINVLFCIICIVGFAVMVLINKMEMDLYQKHEWTTVDAEYKKSISYTEEHSYEDADGETHTEERIRYKWYYEYEMDGQVYDCISSGEVNEEPSGGKDTRTIMVATDDNSVYMLYENEEDFKNSYNFRMKYMILVWGMICLVMICFCKLFRIRKN